MCVGQAAPQAAPPTAAPQMAAPQMAAPQTAVPQAAAMAPPQMATPMQQQQPAGQVMQITCPPGVSPGQQVQVQGPNGQPIAVQVPPGVGPGMLFSVQVPATGMMPQQQMMPQVRLQPLLCTHAAACLTQFVLRYPCSNRLCMSIITIRDMVAPTMAAAAGWVSAPDLQLDLRVGT